jgi:hypothetical protein
VILYVNGDSNTAAAEAVNTYAFAEDDPLYHGLRRQPHPANLQVSYGCELANMMNAVLDCDAESASSNYRIIRTTLEYLNTNRPDFVVIGWATWEREEWEYDGTMWQVNAGGVGEDWPLAIQDRYQEWIVNLDYQQAVEANHIAIHSLHQVMESLTIPHLFFSCFEPFTKVPHLDWNGSYIGPYDFDLTYYKWLKKNGFETVHSRSYHFGPEAHRAWARFLYQNFVQNILTKNK